MHYFFFLAAFFFAGAFFFALLAFFLIAMTTSAWASLGKPMRMDYQLLSENSSHVHATTARSIEAQPCNSQETTVVLKIFIKGPAFSGIDARMTFTDSPILNSRSFYAGSLPATSWLASSVVEERWGCPGWGCSRPSSRRASTLVDPTVEAAVAARGVRIGEKRCAGRQCGATRRDIPAAVRSEVSRIAGARAARPRAPGRDGLPLSRRRGALIGRPHRQLSSSPAANSSYSSRSIRSSSSDSSVISTSMSQPSCSGSSFTRRA